MPRRAALLAGLLPPRAFAAPRRLPDLAFALGLQRGSARWFHSARHLQSSWQDGWKDVCIPATCPGLAMVGHRAGLPREVVEPPSRGYSEVWGCGTKGHGWWWGSEGLRAGLDGLEGLFQPRWCLGSMPWALLHGHRLMCWERRHKALHPSRGSRAQNQNHWEMRTARVQNENSTPAPPAPAAPSSSSPALSRPGETQAPKCLFERNFESLNLE